MNNSLVVIAPYFYEGTWVFDDERAGLVREPIVCGAPEMINHLVAQIPNAKNGFRLLFSGNPFPGYQAEIIWVREDSDSNWYRWSEHDLEGWLCPALFKCFTEAPK